MKALRATCDGIFQKNWVLLLLLLLLGAAANAYRRNEVVCNLLEVSILLSTNIPAHIDHGNLVNCTVLEGSLKIGVFDHDRAPGWSMPNLREITGYLMIYRLSGFKSLAMLFPKLAVIRGQELFVNYALLVYETSGLEDVALPALVAVQRGSVLIEKNPQLCYLTNVNWDAIIQDKLAEDWRFRSNKEENECLRTCPDDCPRNPVTGMPYCWNQYHCQKMSPPTCTDNLGEQICCHQECLAGCSGKTSSNCEVCRSYVDVEGRCVTSCESIQYALHGRRCITKDRCLSTIIQENRYYMTYSPPGQLYECLRECPAGFAPSQNGQSCESCKDHCPKVCPNVLEIESLSSLERLKGCTVLNGHLTISLKGGMGMGRALEENLKYLEYVRDYVEIHRTQTITSLNFLRNLRKIGGKRKKLDLYGLYIKENPNLRDVFTDGYVARLELLNSSKIYFSNNQYLCPTRINSFLKDINITAKPEMIYNTNGDRTSCGPISIFIKATVVGSKKITLSWTRPNISDFREIRGYTIYYKESLHKNATRRSADICDNEAWLGDYHNFYEDRASREATLVQLRPYTQYAIYIEPDFVGYYSIRAPSSIIYVKTNSEVPSIPKNIKVTAGVDKLHLEWQPPENPNGNITHYVVYYTAKPPLRHKLDLRDYCSDPIKPVDERIKVQVQQSMQQENVPQKEGCDCPKRIEAVKKDKDKEFQNMLEDKLLIEMFTKGGFQSVFTINRHRRSVADFMLNGSLHNINETGEYHGEEDEEEEKESYSELKVHGLTNAVLNNLRHFQEYGIWVVACQQDVDLVKGHKLCSDRAMILAKTLKKGLADEITNLEPPVVKDRDVKIRWDDPLHPNGLVVTYEISLKKDSKYISKPTCITHKAFQKEKGYIFKNLEAGNYSYWIQATSLSGPGPRTREMSFLVKSNVLSKPHLSKVVGLAIFGCAVLIILVAVLVWYVTRHCAKSAMSHEMKISVNPEYMSHIPPYFADEWEVSRSKISLIRPLGNGSFGMVYEGVATEIAPGEGSTKVAVKTVNESANEQYKLMFLNEASTMKAFDTFHVVKLLGVVSVGEPALVIMELMPNSDLKTYLRQLRSNENQGGSQSLTLQRIIQWAGQIADGLAYLCDKKFVHRDLAARNCMVSADEVVKIGDFGMTRDIYEMDYYRQGQKGLLPVRWMAPESLRDGLFDSQSDMWSYGVVIWEMATLAAQPYQGLSNEEVLNFVCGGRIMDRPENCPSSLYDIMLVCWRHSPKQRPTFRQIIKSLLPYLDDRFFKASYFFVNDRRKRDNEISMPHPTKTAALRTEGNTAAHDVAGGDEGDNEGETVPFQSASEETLNLSHLDGSLTTTVDSPSLKSRSPPPFERLQRGKDPSKGSPTSGLKLFPTLLNHSNLINDCGAHPVGSSDSEDNEDNSGLLQLKEINSSYCNMGSPTPHPPSLGNGQVPR